MAAQFYKINYKSDFVLTINSDAGWAVPFCIKFWTGMPSHGYFAGFDGENYVNCRIGETPTQLLVMFDDHHMPVGPLRMQIAYHTTIEEFPDRKFDEVTNPTNVTVDIDGTEYQVMLDFTGETGAEIDFSMPSSGVMSVNGKIGYVTLTAEDVGAQPTIEDLATIRSGAAAGATAVQPAEMTAALATKQDTISDLATIRSGAAAGATAYQKPGTGIPASDLASGVQSSLQKADAAAPQSNTYTKGEVDTLIEGAISDIDVDDALSTTSENPVQNKVVTTALNGKQATISDLATIRSGAAAGATAVQPAALTPIENDIDAIEGKIPSAASASNQLADKAFVNSALADKADTSDIPTALSQLSQDSTHRVVTDAEKSTWNGKQNAIDDLATIRSGAAAGATAVQPAAMNTALTAKQDTLTFDNTPTANSNNPVKSSGIKTALDAKQSTINTVNVTVDNNTGTPSGSASVSGSTLSLSFQNLKGATGATGATGPQGPQGERGLPGESGVTGDVSGFTVIQTIDPSATYGATDIAGAAALQAANAELTELGGEVDEVADAINGIYQEPITDDSEDILITNNNDEPIVSVDDSGLKAINLFFEEDGEYKNVKDVINSKTITESETQDEDEEIVFESGNNVVGVVDKDGISAINFSFIGQNAYNNFSSNAKKLELPSFFVKNQVVNNQKRCVVSFNGDSIMGSQLDDLTLCPEYDSGAFPPNMSKMIMARKFYDEFKFQNEDTQFRNLKHSDWVKSGFNKSQKYKPNATEPYTNNDLITYNEIETYGCNSIDDYAQITVTGYKYFKLIWSECSYAGYSFNVRVSVDGGDFIPPSEANIDLPDNVSYNMYAQDATHLMIRYRVCELDTTKTYIIKVLPNNAGNCGFITFWGCEYWNNPRLDVVVEAYSGTTAKSTMSGKLDGFYSDWHKPVFVVMDLLCINDNAYVDGGNETLDEWMKSNAVVIKRCVDNGIPILAYRPHPNNRLVKSVDTFAKMFNLAFIDIRKKMEETGITTSEITNTVDGLHLNNYGQTFYYEELRKYFV